MDLKQNNLADATTGIGFVHVLNENAGETIVSLQREVELDSGETVVVEGITPDKMKTILNNKLIANTINFKTPGEDYNEDIKGVCQLYNEGNAHSDLTPEQIAAVNNIVIDLTDDLSITYDDAVLDINFEIQNKDLIVNNSLSGLRFNINTNGELEASY